LSGVCQKKRKVSFKKMSFEFILRSHEHPDESDEAPVLTIEISDRLLVSASSERANQQQVRQRISKGQYL
jgi:hypothetical protein